MERLSKVLTKTNEPNLIFDPQSHIYKFEDKVVPSVSSILIKSGIIDDRFYNEFGRQRGRFVHEATQYIDEGSLDWNSVDERIYGYLRAYESFKKDSGFKVHLIEYTVFNKEYWYAGTLDRVGTIGDDFVLLDLKTGQTNHATALQTSAYQKALGCDEMCRAAVELRENGSYLFKYFKGEDDFRVFLAAKTIAFWKECAGRRVEKHYFNKEVRDGKISEGEGAQLGA